MNRDLSQTILTRLSCPLTKSEDLRCELHKLQTSYRRTDAQWEYYTTVQLEQSIITLRELYSRYNHNLIVVVAIGNKLVETLVGLAITSHFAHGYQ